MGQETVSKGGSCDRKNLARVDETGERRQILVFMFLPAANNYFRRTSSAAGTPGSPTVV
jgi:hypothetical protein